MKRRMEETIVPALPPNEKFAQEQAAFIVIALNWLLETHEYQHRYEVIENTEYRELLKNMAGHATELKDGGDLLRAIQHAILEPGPSPTDGVFPLSIVIEQTRRFKRLSADLYAALSAQSSREVNPTRRLFSDAAIRQGQRELSFYRRTGYVDSSQDIGEVLKTQTQEQDQTHIA
jgi:hypothetical protein